MVERWESIILNVAKRANRHGTESNGIDYARDYFDFISQ